MRVSPYGAGEIIAGLSVAEIGAQGNYKFSGFAAYYQDVKVFLSGSELTSFGIFDCGDASLNFVEVTGNQNVAGVKTFASSPVIPTATTGFQAMTYTQGVKATGTVSEVITGAKVFSTIPKTTTGRVYSSDRELIDVEELTNQLSSFIGVVTSSQQIKCLPSRAVNDEYSQQTLNGCLGELDTTGTLRGNIILECTNVGTNLIAVGDDETWIANRIDKRDTINRK